MALTHDDVATTRAPTTASLLRWSSVLGGVVIGSALLILLTTLWTALAVGTGVEAVAEGIGWYLAASAIVALFVGGLLAGALSGVPGLGPGMFNGLAVWGVVLILSAAIGAPGALNAFVTPGMELPLEGLEGLEPAQALWPAFWSLLIGAVTAAAGGAIGGAMTRGQPAAIQRETVEHRRAAAPSDRTVAERRDVDRRDADADARAREHSPRHAATDERTPTAERGEPGTGRPAPHSERDYPTGPA